MEKNIIGFDAVVTTSVYVFSFLLIGIPLWWKTTEVYRYPVPYEECQNLLSETLEHSVVVKLLIEDHRVQQGSLWEELLKITEQSKRDTTQPVVSFQWSMSSVSDEEQELISQSQQIADLDTSLDKLHTDSESHGQPQIFILSQNFTNDPKFSLGKGRYGYIINRDTENLVKDIKYLAKKLVQVERLQKLYTPASSYGGDKTPDKERMRYLRSFKKFDITFSLIVPEPQVFDVSWDIEHAVNVYLKETLDELGLISTVNVKSQILYMTSLPISTEPSIRNGKEQFIVHSEHLPSLINPIEAKLGSDTSFHPNLNFVLYIPTGDQTPLQIFDSKGVELESNAFLLPQWGGFMIQNCFAPENASLPHPVALDARAFMKVFLSQFRLLLGLPDTTHVSDDNCQVLKGPVIRKWEMDFLLRKNAQEQLSASISSLSSLSQLLQTISNIVIQDDVGEKIDRALTSTKDSLQLLAEGKLLEGFFQAQSAFVSSDEAFFDPSLLAFLYFPEDQKYAIYIPLFLPIGIPVISSLNHLWKYWRHDKEKIKSV